MHKSLDILRAKYNLLPHEHPPSEETVSKVNRNMKTPTPFQKLKKEAKKIGAVLLSQEEYNHLSICAKKARDAGLAKAKLFDEDGECFALQG